MSVTTTLGACSQTAASNGPDGASDAPSTLDDAIRYALSFAAILRDQGHQYATSVSGTNTITASLLGTPTAYITGGKYSFIVGTTNTGATTLNLSSLGAKNIYRNGAALVAGELIAGQLVTVHYDGTQFQLATDNKFYPRISSALSGTTVDLAVPAGVNAFRLVISGASTGGTSGFSLRLGDSGGVATTSYLYRSIGVVSGGTAIGASSGTTMILLTTATATVAADTYNFYVDFQRATGLEWHCMWTGGGGTGAGVVGFSGWGSRVMSDVLTTVRVTTFSGDTFDAGNAYLIW